MMLDVFYGLLAVSMTAMAASVVTRKRTGTYVAITLVAFFGAVFWLFVA